MKRITAFVILTLFMSVNVFGQGRKMERVLKLERNSKGMFKGNIRNAKLKDIANEISSRVGPKVEVHESIKDKTLSIPFQFDKVDVLGIVQNITVLTIFEPYLKYRKLKGENRYVIEPMGVNTSGEENTEEDLAYYYDTTVVNPEPENTKRIIFKNRRVISGKLIPTSQREVGEKWTVIKDGIEHTKTAEEILPGKKIEFIDRELIVFVKDYSGFNPEYIKYLEDNNWLECNVKERLFKGLVILLVPQNIKTTDKIKEFMDTGKVLYAQPNGISPMTVTWEDVKPKNITMNDRVRNQLPGAPQYTEQEKKARKYRGLYRYTRGYINVIYKKEYSFEERLFFNNKYGVVFDNPFVGRTDKLFASLIVPYFEDTIIIHNKIRNDPRVEHVSINSVGVGSANPDFPCSGDPDDGDTLADNTSFNFSNQWGLIRIGAGNAWCAANSGNKNPVTVAVLDTGYWSGHPDLPDSNSADSNGKDFIPDTQNLPNDDPTTPLDYAGHGTMVASVICAYSSY